MEIAKQTEQEQQQNEENSEDYQAFTCVICRDLLVFPVSMLCGHMFCQSCLLDDKDGIPKYCSIVCSICSSSNSTTLFQTNFMVDQFVKKKFPLSYRKRVNDLEQDKKRRSFESEYCASKRHQKLRNHIFEFCHKILVLKPSKPLLIKDFVVEYFNVLPLLYNDISHLEFMYHLKAISEEYHACMEIIWSPPYLIERTGLITTFIELSTTTSTGNANFINSCVLLVSLMLKYVSMLDSDSSVQFQYLVNAFLKLHSPTNQIERDQKHDLPSSELLFQFVQRYVDTSLFDLQRKSQRKKRERIVTAPLSNKEEENDDDDEEEEENDDDQE